jgi:hypothetical protein
LPKLYEPAPPVDEGGVTPLGPIALAGGVIPPKPIAPVGFMFGVTGNMLLIMLPQSSSRDGCGELPKGLFLSLK